MEFKDVPDVSEQHLPSKHQEGLWGSFVILEDGTDSQGNWHGWCPIHDNVMDPDVPTALFNFLSGVMTCNGEPSCHEGQRTISLTNVLIRMYKK